MKVLEALRTIASRCDGACAEDSMGFNKFDANFGKQLASQSSLTYKQALAGYVLALKYSKQLPEEIEKPIETDFIKHQNTKEEHKKTDYKKAIYKDEKIEIIFSRSNFKGTLEQVKSLDGRVYNPTTKKWKVPITEENLKKLIEFGFTLCNELTKKLTELSKPLEVTPLNIKLSKPLYPYQKQGVEFIEAMGGRALIGDEMGLGKTVQAITYLELHPELRPAIIVCPASMKYVWEKEIQNWINKKSNILSGRNGNHIQDSDIIIIINYDILSARVKELKNINPKIVISDECHYLKNPKAIRTKAFNELCKKVPHVIALSGTPIINRPIEFFNILNILNSTLFPNRWTYAKKYCNAHQTRFGWDTSGASNLEELNKKLSKIMIRRKKEEVLKELPPKTRTITPLEIKNKKEYDKAANDIINWIRENEGKEKAEKAKGAEVLVQIEKLKQLIVNGKMEQVIDWIENFLESGEKLVVFATHTQTLDLLETHFNGKTVRVDGKTSSEQRQKNVVEFQSSQHKKLFLGNIKAAGVGLTLTASSNTCFVELAWSPGEHQQAEDRVHRIGQKDNVTAHYLIAKDTIEEDIINLIEKKSKILDQVLDGKSTKESSIFTELLQNLK